MSKEKKKTAQADEEIKETEVGDKAEETKIDETIADETITDEESVLETVVDIDTLKEKAEKA
ncbi:MAG: hypothetical protein Q8873_07625, partial [Bacillota bacterium]|nr:hypothetical protein [Bacillota bacterium]